MYPDPPPSFWTDKPIAVDMGVHKHAQTIAVKIIQIFENGVGVREQGNGSLSEIR